MLQVRPTANTNEIRRAYYRASRRCHPDKVGASSHSTARFQELSEAYRILRRPELRRAYDRGGVVEVEQMATTVDLGLLYDIVLSGAQWEPYVGKFALSRILGCAADRESCHVRKGAEDVDQRGSCIDELINLWTTGEEDGAVKAWQTRREVNCAVALARRLLPAMTSGQTGLRSFEADTRKEAARLAELRFGPGLLRVIAAVYESEAVRFLGATRSLLDPTREMEDVRAHWRLLALQGRSAVTAVRALLALRKLLMEEESEGGSASGSTSAKPKENQASSLSLERPAVQEQLPALASALWSLTVLDIEGTLRRVCRRVLRDKSEGTSVRLRRAEALRVSARVLREAADGRNGTEDAGLPGEDQDLLRTCVQDAAAQLASGCFTTAAASADSVGSGFGSS